MDSEQVLDRVIETVREELDDDRIALTPATAASSVDGWDSLAQVRIMIALEQAFGVRFTTAEITSLKNVGALVELIQAKL